MKEISQAEWNKMLDLAFEAMTHAYVPYSGFYVGACLKAASGKYYLGCNIENAAYSPTNCAERTAMFKAVYEGEREFDALVVVCSGDAPAFPCGVCRQVLSEFCCADMPILCSSRDRVTVQCTLSDLLPHSFGREDLKI